jgi:hypothetical protein
VSDEWRGPSRRYLSLRRIEIVVATAAASVAVGILVAWKESGVVAGVCVAAVVLAGVVGLVVVQRRFEAWGYAERGEDLFVKRGVLFARLSVVPYGRMQFVDVTAGPLERSFRLATVKMHTAAAASDARIPGLEREEAARLRDRLAELGEAQAAGI